MLPSTIRRILSLFLVYSCLAFLSLNAYAAPLWTVSGGKIYKDGEPFFPRGFYYVSHYANQKTQRLTDLKKIAAAGYNFMATPVDMNDKPLLDSAASLGVYVCMEPNADPATLMKTFGGHQALASIATFDDVDAYTNGVPRHTPAKVAQTSSSLKALSPNMFTYISGGYPSRITNYLGTADVMALQSYPIPYEDLNSVTYSYFNPIMPKMRAAGQPLIANLQTFPWYGTSTSRYPTAVEIRNMTYQALLQGVAGIFYYAYFDVWTNLNNKTALWTELTKLSSELKVLEPYLLKAQRLSLTTGKTDAFATSWKLGKDLIVMVVNTSQSSGKAVSLKLNELLSGTSTNLFANRTGRMTLSGNTLSGTLPQRDVQVYKLGLR